MSVKIANKKVSMLINTKATNLFVYHLCAKRLDMTHKQKNNKGLFCTK